MPTTIVYTDTATSHTVKPTQTQFTNNTDKDIVLQFQSTDKPIKVGETSDKISTTIVSIKYGATIYYSAKGNDYTINAGKTVTLTKTGNNIDMNIP